jgi:hypothetical protein
MHHSKFPIVDEDKIPNEDTLYRRIHKAHVDRKNNEIMPMAFPTEDDGLSVNWSRFTNAEDTKNEVIVFGKLPENYGVVSLIIGLVRAIPLRVIHDPTQNQAHSLILDIPPRKPNGLGIRVKLQGICKWEIQV